MLGCTAWRTHVRKLIATVLMTLILIEVVATTSVYASGANTSSVVVSPGKYDLKLGDDFPTFGSVKLSYPDSAILTNSTGELLFSINLEPLMFNPISAQAGSSVAFWVAGFSLADASCTLSGPPILGGPLPFIPLNGVLAGVFTVANVPSGSYVITARCNPKHDYSANVFTVTLFSPPTPATTPISTAVSIDLYIPPDFSGLAVSDTWTSFTNNYDSSSIRVGRLGSSDAIEPNGWRVTISNITVTYQPKRFSTPLIAHRLVILNQTQYIRLFQVGSPETAGRYFFKAFINGISIGAENFPTLVVKGSRDPAYISGVLREWGDRDFAKAGQPISLGNGTGARVVATGYDYLGHAVSAQAFVNSTADGNYTLFGVAPGTYNITAYAAGYAPAYRPETVSVLAAQSLEGVDIFMSESVEITGTVLSTCYGSPIPWGTLTSFSFGGGSSVVRRAISVQVLNLDGSVAAQTPINSTFTTPTATQFNFTIQRFVGLDGRIPQDYANYTSGLTWGDYLLRAYVTSYIQLVEVRVHVLNTTTDAQAQIPLVRTGQFFVTVHFKDSNSTIAETPTAVSGELTVSAYDQEGILRAQNSTQVPAHSNSTSIALMGFSSTRTFGTGSLLPTNNGLPPGTYHITARFTAGQLFFGGNGGTTSAAGDLYFQLNDMEATIGLACGANVSISFSIYRAGGLNLTIYPVTYQIPPVFENYWAHPNSSVRVTMESQYGDVYQGSATQPTLSRNNKSTLKFSYQGLLPGTYVVYVQTLGYTQTQLVSAAVILGADSDASVYMIKNPVIDLTIAFRHENILTTLNSSLPFAQPINHIDATPTRIEVFDDRGNFVSANATYIGNGNSTFHFRLAGFDQYAGDPRNIYAGFYDTTDGRSQTQGGLFLYPWSFSPRTFIIRIWIDGYYQLTPLEVTIRPPQNASVVALLDRSSRIYGSVLGPDFFDQARHLSWATITLEPDNYTLTNIIDVEPGNYSTSSLDGDFQLWVPQGDYGIGASLEGYASYQSFIHVPSGSDMNMQIWLDNYQPSSNPQYSLQAPCSLASPSCPSNSQKWLRRNL